MRAERGCTVVNDRLNTFLTQYVSKIDPVQRSLMATLVLLLSPWLAYADSLKNGLNEGNQHVPLIEQSKTVSGTFDRNGRLWLVWTLGKHIYVNYSDDFGSSYSLPVKVNSEPQNVEAHGESRPQIAVSDKGNIYVVYNQKLEKRFSGHVRFSRSVDGGKSFINPLIVNSDLQVIGHSFGQLSLNKMGHIYITWLDSRDVYAAKKKGQAYDGSSIYYTVSFDEGESFEPNVKLQDHSCQCCRITSALDQHNLPVIVWRQIFNKNIRDHGLIRFTDKTAFTSMIRVSKEDWAIESCPHHGPSLAIGKNDRYYLTWFTGATDLAGIYYAYSTNQGKQFSSPMKLGNDNRQAKHPYVFSTGQHVHIVWKEFDGEITTIQQIQSIDNGESWSTPRTLSQTLGSSDHPFLIATDKNVYLSWQTGEGYHLIPVENDIDKKEVALR